MAPLRPGLRRGLRLFGLEGLLLALFIALPHISALYAPIEPYRRIIAGAAFALAFGIGWRFARGRIVHALLVLLAAAAIPMLPAASLAWLLAAVLVPLDLGLLSLLPDRGIVSRGGRIRLALIAAQAITVAVLASIGPAPAIPAAIPLAATTVVLLAFGVALVALTAQAVSTGAAPARGMLWATAAALASHAGLAGGTLWLLAGGAAALVAAAIEDAHALAFRDGLTGLPSRRALDEALQRISGRYTLAMVDVDRFKLINDGFGHSVGDQVLRMVAKRLRQTGGGARAFRYGGEEFALLFKGKTLIEARPWLESARRNVENARFILRNPGRPRRRPRGARGKGPTKKRLKVTVSIGVADRTSGPQPLVVAKAADGALYRAKKAGRNRVMVA